MLLLRDKTLQNFVFISCLVYQINDVCRILGCPLPTVLFALEGLLGLCALSLVTSSSSF